MISRVKGTQDFLDLTLLNFIIDNTKQHLQVHHYTEIATPLLEPIELFKRSLGLYTDVVTKEMFVIDNRGKEPELCLRPEMTASMVRAFVENGVSNTPWNVFSWGPLFRHERPQKGRYRQFHQVSMEMIGATTFMHDVQCIEMLDTLFSQIFKLTNYALELNYLGTPEDREQYKTVLMAFLETHADTLCATCQIRKDTNCMRVFDCKNETCAGLYKTAPVITDHLSAKSQKEWHALKATLELLGVVYMHRPTLVRGLDYYSKTVFEFVSDDLGSQNAFCGGGRYDFLVKQIGGKKDQPSFGAAFGIERLMLLLEPLQDQLGIVYKPALHVIAPIGAEKQTIALLLAQQMRAQGLCVESLLDGASIKSMMRTANRLGATYALIIGDEEHKNNTVTVKHMHTGKSETVLQADVVRVLKK